LDRAGLFLWAAADGTFVLDTPNGAQDPSYRLVRQRDDKPGASNVKSYHYSRDATHRHSEVVVYGKGGGRKQGRAKSKGGFEDEEMIALGYKQQLVLRDPKCENAAQALFLAKRRIAEERRQGIRLEYTIAGHTLPAFSKDDDNGGASRFAVVTPDTVVQVDDHELGIHGPWYIERVRRTRSPHTETTLGLMRPEDLVFGEV
jgi:prophage tail gpP-like protein